MTQYLVEDNTMLSEPDFHIHMTHVIDKFVEGSDLCYGLIKKSFPEYEIYLTLAAFVSEDMMDRRFALQLQICTQAGLRTHELFYNFDTDTLERNINGDALLPYFQRVLLAIKLRN